MPAVVLTYADLISRISERTVIGYFDDDGDGVVDPASTEVQDVLQAAEGELFSRILRAFPGDVTSAQSAIRKLIATDKTLLQHLAWVGCEMAAERRPEFCAADGSGPYKVQYDRALVYFDNISKGNLRSMAEYVENGSGVNPQVGGNMNPPIDSVAANFIFAPDRNAPTGRGGF